MQVCSSESTPARTRRSRQSHSSIYRGGLKDGVIVASDYTFNPFFPVNTLQIMRGAVIAKSAGMFDRYVRAVYRHMWAEPKKMDEPDVIREALLTSGLPADEILDGMQNPEVKQQLITNTSSSVARGVFGSPSFFVGDELFFGKDKPRDVFHGHLTSNRTPSRPSRVNAAGETSESVF